MPDRRNFLKSALLPAGALFLSPAVSLQAQQQPSDLQEKNDNPLSQRLRMITAKTTWTLVDQIKLSFKTFHCQGMVKIDQDFWVSSVEMAIKSDGTIDRSKGKGHLFRIDPTGRLLADIPIGTETIFHPSGIDFDGQYIWIAAAEYRPDSHAIIYRCDPLKMQLQEIFQWPDHIGAITRNKDTNTLHGISWGSRKWYRWELDHSSNFIPSDPSRSRPAINPSFYIDYQDNQYLGNDEVLYTGLSVYKKSDGSVFALGGLEIVDLRLQLPVHQVPIQLWSPATGAVITQNPSYFELTLQSRIRAHFLPDDNDSTLYIYEDNL